MSGVDWPDVPRHAAPAKCDRCGDPIDHDGPLCTPCDDAEYFARRDALEGRDE